MRQVPRVDLLDLTVKPTDEELRALMTAVLDLLIRLS